MIILNPYSYATSSGDPFFSNVSALLHFNGANNSTTFTDETGKIWTAVGNSKLSTGTFKYGTASGLFDGTGDYITTPSHADFDFGSGDFTVEAWVRPNFLGDNANKAIICRDQIGGTRGWLFYTAQDANPVPDALTFAAWVGGTVYSLADTAPLSTDQFYHAAVVRQGGTLRMYKNGVQVATNTTITGSVGAPTEPCVIGNLWGVGTPVSAAQSWNGWIDDVRVTKGVCRYPNGTTFTPPTTEFPGPPVPAYRYWRIFITANNGSGFVSMNEVQLRLTAGGADQTDAIPGGSTAYTTASSSFFGDNGARAYDNDTADTGAWVAAWAGGPHWVRVDFGAGNSKSIAEVAIWPESSESYTRAPQSFIIQGSTDDSTWFDVKTYSGITGWSSYGAGGGGIYRTFSTT